MNRAVLRAARNTRVLGGQSVRVLNNWLYCLGLLGIVAAIELSGVLPSGALATAVPLGVFVVGLFVLYKQLTRGVVRNNQAVALLEANDVDGANRVFAALAHGFHTRTLAAVSLYNLSFSMMRRGEFADAAALARAAIEVQGDRSRSALTSAPHHALYAMALACVGSLDEAVTEMARLESPGATVFTRASVVRTRAFVAFRQGHFEETLSILRASRALLRNTMHGWNAALVDALESESVARLGGAYRGSAARPSGLPYDTEARSLVARLIPGATTALLARESVAA